MCIAYRLEYRSAYYTGAPVTDGLTDRPDAIHNTEGTVRGQLLHAKCTRVIEHAFRL